MAGRGWGVHAGALMLAWLAGSALALHWPHAPARTALAGCALAAMAIAAASLARRVATTRQRRGAPATGSVREGGTAPALAMPGDTPRPAPPVRAVSRRLGSLTASGAWLMVTALLAFALTGARIHARLAVALDPRLEGRDLVVQGVIASLPQALAGGQRFEFEVERASLDGAAVALPPRLLLGWYRMSDGDPLALGPTSTLAAGQRWRFGVRLRAPHGLVNPHGFDAELWLFERGLRATGTVRASASQPAERLEVAQAGPVAQARQALRDAIAAQVASPRAAGVLAALAVGDQAAIARADWDVFRDTGVAHLLSISGLHVTMFAWLAGGAIGALWRRWPRALLLVPAPTLARWAGLAAAAGYALLAGWGVPAQRTLWMLACVTVLASLGVRWPWPLVLASSALLVCAIDPWALLQPGFWLSFVAVGLLLLSHPLAARAADTQGAVRAPADAGPAAAASGDAGAGADAGGSARWPRRTLAMLHGGLRTQAVATFGLAPLTLVWFQQLSLVGLLANLVAIPLVTLLITPLALLGALWPLLWRIDALLVEGLAAGLAWLAAWPGAVWSTAAAPAWAQALGLVAGALLVAPLPWRVRALALPLLLPLAASSPPRPAHGSFELLAADIGQGNAVLVRTRGHLLLYDAGPSYGPEFDAGQRVLLPLLRARGERRIDVLLLSHADSDHTGGAASLLAALPVTTLLSTLPGGHPLRTAARATTARDCVAGLRWQWDGVEFDVLHPGAAQLARANPATPPNSLSCVLRVRDRAGRGALLAGDIEAAQEAALVAADPAALRAEVLLVPHHGSRTSSTPAFVAAVAPHHALAQAGYRNRYGHPAADVMARYETGSGFVRSDACGAWHWPADAAPACERARQPSHWRHVMPP